MSFYKAYVVAIGSLLTGAAVVHNIYKPDLVTYRPLLQSFCVQTFTQSLLRHCIQLGLLQRLRRSTSHNNTLSDQTKTARPTSARLPAENPSLSQAKLKRGRESPDYGT